MEYKALISVIASILVFIGYAPYIRDTVRGVTRPHAYTWLVWTLSAGITAGLQIYGGAGVGAWVTVAITLVCLLIFLLAIKYGSRDVRRIDAIFLVLAFVSLGFWLLAQQPITSLLLIVSVNVLGMAPTVRKSWNDPSSETLISYFISAFRHSLSIFALETYNVLTLLFPVVWVCVNVAFCAFLLARRVILKSESVV